MTKRISIVNYAVNGSGIGHVTRLAAVSRWLRRYAAQLDVKADVFFLTSSEAGNLLFREHFPSFKLPSKTILEECGIDESEFLNIAQPFIAYTLELLRPDLFIVDTFPCGYYNELPETLNALAEKMAVRKVFIYRPLKASHALAPSFQEMLAKYDLLLVPEDEDKVPPIITPDSLRHKLRFIGAIIARERDELLARTDARRELGISDDKLAVYITAGGGGDATAEHGIRKIYDALRHVENLHLVIAAGSLYCGRPIYGDDGKGNAVTWLTQSGVIEFMSGFDLAIASAGYNTFNELMFAGVPTIFAPQAKWADDQRARARRAVEAAAAVMLDSCDDAIEIRRYIEQWRAPSKRAQASLRAQRLVSRNHARDAARELLKLILPIEPEADQNNFAFRQE